ncbi:hypothetical protein [Clostridium sp. CF012]|uniref:hypothetical protein n=1 Tax=Clostridium sp. CF012 TaxID=2843319 RepID=UPI001C0E1A7F|nr:hypothetical protein [Clostridium sp. CF012]MBU3142336.1 hypothetical protein [Clostridium sp. CF012]
MNEQFEALVTANKYILKLQNGIKEAIKFFQGGNDGDALKITSEILEGLAWVIDIVSLTQNVQKNKVNAYEFCGELKEMEIALQNEDYILVSDILQYEILPVLEVWGKEIDKSVAI